MVIIIVYVYKLLCEHKNMQIVLFYSLSDSLRHFVSLYGLPYNHVARNRTEQEFGDKMHDGLYWTKKVQYRGGC